MSEVKEEKLKCNITGRVKKTNQTMKSNKENQKKLNGKKRNKTNLKNKMQILKDREVKFVSGVGMSLLTSF